MPWITVNSEPPKQTMFEDLGYVQVVLCKDCKHLFDGEHTDNCCDVLMEKTGWLKEISVSLDWFCADGERRDADA